MRLINGISAKIYQREWRKANSDKVKVYSKRAHAKWDKIVFDRVKTQVYVHYGAVCRCCGERNSAFLSLDHVNNDGAKQRRKIGTGREVFYRWIIKNKFPASIQVLCMNCQWGKRRLGTCPHQNVRGLNG